MKMALIVPYFDQQRGNTVTVNRISNGLVANGLQTEIINMSDKQSLSKRVEADLFHGFHAYQFSLFKEKTPFHLTPYMITMTGTDLNRDLFQEDRETQVIETLVNAEAVHVFTEQAKQTVLQKIPSIAHKLYIIPQGVTNFAPTTSLYPKEGNTFLFILPAGLRKVKNISEAITMLASLHEKLPHIRLWLIGPILEEEEGNVILQLVEKHKDWIHYLGHLPHEQMGAIYEQGDVVLNTSISEGQPSAILEAMSLGVPPIVSNNDGNKSIVTNEWNGYVYKTKDEFMMYAKRLIGDGALRNKLGKNAQTYIRQHHSLKQEIKSLRTIYDQILNEK